jgi:hypothetical protein
MGVLEWLAWAVHIAGGPEKAMRTAPAPQTSDATDATGPDQQGGLWYVRLPTGEVRAMTLDEVDAAYQAGHIDEETAMLRHGTTRWAKLRDLAGLDSAQVDESGPTIPHSGNTPTARPAPAPPPSARPVGSVPTPGAFAVDFPSVRPVASDVDGSQELSLPPGFRRDRRKAVMIAGLAAGLLLGVGLALTQLNTSAEPATAAAVSVSTVDPTLPPVVAATPLSSPTPPPLTPATSAPSTDPALIAAAAAAASGTAPSRLTDDQTKALLDRDKTRLKKTRTVPRHASPGGKNVFHKGGAKYDPLNSTL